MGGDFFRSRPGRYLGYAHVVGSALPGDIVSPAAKMWMTRATVAYIAFDVFFKATDRRSPNMVSKGVDALLWQGLASIVIPGFIVQGAAQVSALVANSMQIKSPTNRYVSLGFVLLSMPLLGGTVDRGVDFVFNHTTRPIIF